ncbi:MAG: FAD binding domain-containing protein [Pseudomonadota bacterium]
MTLIVETFPTLAETARALRARSRYLGGGTLVMRAANYGDQSFERILRTTDPSLAEIHREGDRLVIGAGVTMAAIMNSPDLDFLAPAAQAVGGPAIRNMGTVGGNLFAPAPYGDLAAALLALDATVRMAEGGEQPMEAFLAGRERAPGLVAAVSLRPPGRGDFRFLKVSRVKPKGVSVLSIAAHLPRPMGRLANARLAFGAMGPTPLRAKAAERALEGATLDAAGIAPALAACTEGLAPVDDAIASAWYRREVAPVHLSRLLLEGGPRS